MRSSGSLAVLVLLIVPMGAQAGFITYSGTLNPSSPTFNHPVENGDSPPAFLSDVGTNVFYSTQQFSVNVSNTYTLEVIGPSPDFDSYLVLYQNAFNPASPLSNALGANDDGSVPFLSRIDVPLSPGVQYFLVTTTFDNGTDSFPDPASGAVTFTNRLGNDVTGNVVTLGTAVPEPSAFLLASMGGLGLLGYAWRRCKCAGV